MRHRVKKIKFKGGRDATRMLTRKLLANFLKRGTLTSTKRRIQVLRTEAEIVINKAKRNTESDRNYLSRRLGDQEIVKLTIREIAPVFKERVGGYVRIVKLGRRDTDGAERSRLEWVQPVVLSEKKKKEKKAIVKSQDTKNKKQTSSKVQKPKVAKKVSTKKVAK